jgi:phenylpyruvate tautomerase PptA (4-oxalocrotonate tautomerase family)
MPIIEVHLFKGHSKNVRTRLMNALADAYRMVIPAPIASLSVALHELDGDNYMRGGAKRRLTPALSEPVSIMMAYLRAVQSGDVEAACSFLTEDCSFHLPGGMVVTSPFELLDWAEARSRHLEFTVLATDTGPGETGPVVHLRGTVAGEWLDGVPFEGIRTVTRYEFHGDKIRRLEMWSDLGEAAAERGGFSAAAPDAEPDSVAASDAGR